MYQVLGMHPAQRVAAEIQQVGIVAEDDGITQQAVGCDATPEQRQRARGPGCPRCQAAPDAPPTPQER